jgi:hypothetical protein
VFKCPTDCPVTDSVFPKLCHFYLGLVSVGRHKDPELFPVTDLVAMTPMLCGLGVNVAGFGFEAKPLDLFKNKEICHS